MDGPSFSRIVILDDFRLSGALKDRRLYTCVKRLRSLTAVDRTQQILAARHGSQAFPIFVYVDKTQ